MNEKFHITAKQYRQKDAIGSMQYGLSMFVMAENHDDALAKAYETVSDLVMPFVTCCRTNKGLYPWGKYNAETI
jgi:hypothetical protein